MHCNDYGLARLPPNDQGNISIAMVTLTSTPGSMLMDVWCAVKAIILRDEEARTLLHTHIQNTVSLKKVSKINTLRGQSKRKIYRLCLQERSPPKLNPSHGLPRQTLVRGIFTEDGCP